MKTKLFGLAIMVAAATSLNAQVQIGDGARVGSGAVAIGENSIAIGSDTKSDGREAISINGNAEGISSIAIGAGNAIGYSSIAIGTCSNANNKSLAIGAGSQANGTSSICLGKFNTTALNADYSIALGTISSVHQPNSGMISVGPIRNHNYKANSIALGSNSTTPSMWIFGQTVDAGANSGNLGVGTDNPTHRITAKTGTNSKALLLQRSNNYKLMTVEALSNYGILDLYDQYQTSDVRLNTNGTSYFRGGNVAIGTTSASARLEVYKATTLGGKYNANKSVFTVRDQTCQLIMDGNEIYSDNTLVIGTPSTNDLIFRNTNTGSYSTIMTLKGSGKVTIGTTATNGQLNVAGKDNDAPLVLSPQYDVPNNAEGGLYYNKGSKKYYYNNGAGWQEISSGIDNSPWEKGELALLLKDRTSDVVLGDPDLEVIEGRFRVNNETKATGIFSTSNKNGVFNIGVKAGAKGGYERNMGVAGYASRYHGQEAIENIGVNGVASGAMINYGGKFYATSDINSPAVNCGIYAEGKNSGASTGISAFLVGDVCVANGDLYVYSGDVTANNVRAKNDISNALDKISKVQGIETAIKRNGKKELSYEFNANQLEEILPELVVRSDSSVGINYLKMMPVFVEALKEQQTIIDKQNERISALETTQGVSSITTFEKAELMQNIPNPWTEQTEIRYSLPETATNAMLMVYDLSGKQMKTVDITATGDGSIFLNANELQPGMYIYTLIADGKEINSKRMILTE